MTVEASKSQPFPRFSSFGQSSNRVNNPAINLRWNPAAIAVCMEEALSGNLLDPEAVLELWCCARPELCLGDVVI
jgi:hypothetical protein